MENLLSPRLLSHLWEIYFSLFVASPLIGKNPDHNSPQYGNSLAQIPYSKVSIIRPGRSRLLEIDKKIVMVIVSKNPVSK